MYQRAFAVVSDERFFPGLWALLNSVEAYYGREYRVFVVGHRLPPGLVAELRGHPLGPALSVLDGRDFARPPAGAWEAKQSVPAELCGRAGVVCLLDADLVLLSRLDDVFGWAEAGRIVSSRDGADDIALGDDYAAYGGAAAGTRMPYFNSGFLCLDLRRHWRVAALWEFTARFAGYSPGGGPPYSFPGHGDQGLLNGVVASLDERRALHLLPQETWCNSAGWTAAETVDIVGADGPALAVRHRRLGEPQRVLHSTGPKWWEPEGREHFARSGDVLRCFDHFAALRPRRPGPAPAGGPPPGALRYVGDISRQDAQVLAEHAAGAARILEFGVGASTQVLAQVAPPGAVVTTVETDPEWVRRTRENLAGLPTRAEVRFVPYADWEGMDVGVVDLVFVDGVADLRAAFAERAWGFLRVGGALLVHDTRRAADAAAALDLAARHHLEVARVELNARASNVTVVRKKVPEPYVNWNYAEAAEDPGA